jgi:ribosomal protein S18 acetylase RimI-like enzyme
MLITKNNGLDIIDFRQGKENTWEIFDIKVTSTRRKGIGRALVEEMIETVNPRIVYAFTREENLDARAFYKAVGFNEILIPNFYQEGNAIMVIYENSLYRKI